MIGGIVLGGWVVALCAWMAFGENESTWVREGLRTLMWVVLFIGGMLLFFWAAQGFGYFEN